MKVASFPWLMGLQTRQAMPFRAKIVAPRWTYSAAMPVMLCPMGMSRAGNGPAPFGR
jgi:hypothetical protein